MVVTESTVGGSSPDYASINAWEAARQTSSSSGDTERALCRSATFDEHPIINGWTSGVIIEITPDSGAEHGGIEGTGPILDPSTSGHCLELTETDCTILLDGIEFTGVVTDSDEGCRINGGGVQPTFRNCLFYDLRVATDCDGIYFASTGSTTIQVENCYFRNIDRGGCHHQYGRGPATWNLLNCTMWADTVDAMNSGVQLLTDQNPDSVTFNIYNTIIGGNINNCVFKDAGSGTKVLNMYQCIVDDTSPTTHADVTDNVTESATFQEGTGGSGTRVMFLDLTASGGYDLHLEDDANNAALDYGDGADAPSSGLDWEGDTRATTGTDNVDAGCDEVTSSTPSGVGAMDMLMPTMSATGTVAHQATSAMDMLMPTMSATGEAGNKTATSAMDILLPTISANGSVGIKTGTSAMTMLVVTQNAEGTVVHHATSNPDMLPPTMTGAGELTYKGTSASDMPVPTMSSAGEAGNKEGTSSIDILLPGMTGTGTVGEGISGTSTTSILIPEATSAGHLTYRGASTTAIPIQTMISTGEVGNKEGTSTIDLLIPGMSGSGTHGEGTTGTSGMTMLEPSMDATGQLEYRGTSSMEIILPGMTGSGEVSGAVTGTSAMDIPLLTMTASGTVVTAKVGTSTIVMLLPAMSATGTGISPATPKQPDVNVPEARNAVIVHLATGRPRVLRQGRRRASWTDSAVTPGTVRIE